MGDKAWEVRYDAAGNPNATPEVLMRALEDEHKDIRSAAQERLQKDPILQIQVAALKAQKITS
jgi:hypothetical protein